jgi:hypothetical protein
MRRRRRAQAYGQWTPNLVDPTGTRRRLQALHAIGWTAADIGQRLGVTSQRVTAIINDHHRRHVHTTTASRVQAVYDQLSMTPGPSLRTRQRATKADWHRPLCWDDDLIDDPTHQPAGCCGRAPRRGLPDDPDWLAARANEAGYAPLVERFNVTDDSIRKALRRAGYRNTAPPGRPAHWRKEAAA